MKILVDINHPAHVHFFRNAILKLESQGHDIAITASNKECTRSLLEAYELVYIPLDATHTGSLANMAGTLVRRDWQLHQAVKNVRPDVMASIGGTFIAHVGKMNRIPSVVFYDTAEARLQNLITYPFTTQLVVPDVYDGWTPRKRTVRYRGCHELAYLAPKYFTPSRATALEHGLHPERSTVLVRTVSWTANHDIGLSGLSAESAESLIKTLTRQFNIVISSETELSSGLEQYRYRGPANAIHHLMAFSSALISESATMASESAVLGVPALLVGSSQRCYTRWLELEYGLIQTLAHHGRKTIADRTVRIASKDRESHLRSRSSLLADCVDVTEVICDRILFAGQR